MTTKKLWWQIRYLEVWWNILWYWFSGSEAIWWKLQKILCNFQSRLQESLQCCLWICQGLEFSTFCVKITICSLWSLQKGVGTIQNWPCIFYELFSQVQWHQNQCSKYVIFAPKEICILQLPHKWCQLDETYIKNCSFKSRKSKYENALVEDYCVIETIEFFLN